MANKQKKLKPEDKPLSPKQERFVEAILNPDTTARQAALDAGYATGPEGSISANVQATKLLRLPNIAKRIAERKKEVAQFANITPAQVLGATALRAFATIDDAFDDEGHFDIKKARETGAIHLIKKISRTMNKYGETIAVEFYSNESAQDKLGQYLGMERLPMHNPETIEKVLKAYDLWAEKNPHTTPVERADAIERFARGSGMMPEQLAEKIGVELITNSLQ